MSIILIGRSDRGILPETMLEELLDYVDRQHRGNSSPCRPAGSGRLAGVR